MNFEEISVKERIAANERELEARQVNNIATVRQGILDSIKNAQDNGGKIGKIETKVKKLYNNMHSVSDEELKIKTPPEGFDFNKEFWYDNLKTKMGWKTPRSDLWGDVWDLHMAYSAGNATSHYKNSTTRCKRSGGKGRGTRKSR
jgi:hypothetical protein